MEIKIIKNGEICIKTGFLAIAISETIKGFVESASEYNKIHLFSINESGYSISPINYDAMLDYEVVNKTVKDNCLKNGELLFVCNDNTFIKITPSNGYLVDYKKRSYNDAVEIEAKSKDKLYESSKGLIAMFIDNLVNPNNIYDIEYAKTKKILENLSKSLSGIKPPTGYDFSTYSSDEVKASTKSLAIANLGKALHHLYSGDKLSTLEMQIIAVASTEERIIAMNLYSQNLFSKSDNGRLENLKSSLEYIRSLEEDIIDSRNIGEKTAQKV